MTDTPRSYRSTDDEAPEALRPTGFSSSGWPDLNRRPLDPQSYADAEASATQCQERIRHALPPQRQVQKKLLTRGAMRPLTRRSSWSLRAPLPPSVVLDQESIGASGPVSSFRGSRVRVPSIVRSRSPDSSLGTGDGREVQFNRTRGHSDTDPPEGYRGQLGIIVPIPGRYLGIATSQDDREA